MNTRTRSPPLAAANPAAALDYEIAQEKATTLGRLARQLEGRLAALAAFDTAHAANDARGRDEPEQREALVAEAGLALWHFVVQREVCGLSDSARAMRDYGVPNEVRARMGAFPPMKAGTAAR